MLDLYFANPAHLVSERQLMLEEKLALDEEYDKSISSYKDGLETMDGKTGQFIDVLWETLSIAPFQGESIPVYR